MSRQLLCRKCGDKFQLYPEDKAHGFFLRKTYLSLGYPDGKHGVIVNGEFTPMSEYLCDLCSEVISNTVAVAISIFKMDSPIGNWEEEFGQVVPWEAVKVADKLIQ